LNVCENHGLAPGAPANAARVILGAGIVVYMGPSLQFKELALVPFTLSAQIAHTIGALCQSGRHDDLKSA